MDSKIDNTVAVKLMVHENEQQELLNQLYSAQLLAVEEQENCLICYSEDRNWEELFHLAAGLSKSLEKEVVAYCFLPTNWNEEWEANYDPIHVPNRCFIRASFHETIESDLPQIVLNPQMSFGTGHHETTQLVLGLMKDSFITEKKVLDYGCGTGILAIYAGIRGAKEIHAIDYDINCYESTLENCLANGNLDVKVSKGEIKDVSEVNFDLILANINRKVLLRDMDVISSKLSSSGQLIISGILLQDFDKISQSLRNNKLHIRCVSMMNNWLAISSEK